MKRKAKPTKTTTQLLEEAWAAEVRRGNAAKLTTPAAKRFVDRLVKDGVLRPWAWVVDGQAYAVLDDKNKPVLVAGDKWDEFLAAPRVAP